MRNSVILLTAGAVALGASACDDPFSGLERDPVEGTGVIYSLARAENIGYPSAFDLTPMQPREVVIEDPQSGGAWDIALSEEDGAFVLVPSAAEVGAGNGAIVRYTDMSYVALTEAPGDTAVYERAQAVPLTMDAVYVVRSRRRSGSRCVHFSKLRPTELDEAEGRLTFEYLMNPNCNDRNLEPAEDDD